MTGIRLYFGRIIAAPRGYQEKSEVDHCAFPYYSQQKIEYQKPKFEVSAIRAQLPTLRYYTMQVVKMQEKNRKKTEILFCIKVVVKMQEKNRKKTEILFCIKVVVKMRAKTGKNPEILSCISVVVKMQAKTGKNMRNFLRMTN